MSAHRDGSGGLLYEGVRALIVGLAREGTAVARWLADRGARVTATDLKPASAMCGAVDALARLPIDLVLGEHPLSLLDQTDIAFVSPGVPGEIPLLAEARRRGVPLSSETRLFSQLCQATILGITASSGKTTTTALVSEIMNAAGHRTWVGGNIGRPLLPHVNDMLPSDMAVLELSSFQLEYFAPWSTQSSTRPGGASPLFDPAGWSPPIAAVLNVTPNHLDRHPTMEAYVAAKAQIIAHQAQGDVAVLGYDNPTTRAMGLKLDKERRILWFSLDHQVEDGAFLQGDHLILRLDGEEAPICRSGELRLLGRHNVSNVLAACALAAGAGVPVEAMRQAATSFTGVEHRLELVRELNGVRWYNDSIATTPERTVAALLAFHAPIILLAGGRDKHLPWEEMAALTWQKAQHLILFGEAAGLIDREMRRSEAADRHACQIHHANTLEASVQLAARLATPGTVVLLAPGGTSFDSYPDFAARGEHFRQLVKALKE